MNDMNNRIDILISKLNITQKQFAEKINLKPNTLSMIKSGKRSLTDRSFCDICREFNVNKTWLKTGMGEIFEPTTEETKLAYMLGELCNSDNKLLKGLIPKIIHLDIEELEILNGLVNLLNKKDKK